MPPRMSIGGSAAGPYTPVEVDIVVKTLEDNAAKLHVFADKAIKLRASEVNLLKDAEGGSKLLKKAMKGDKQFLSDVFGANSCERIGRLRVIIDSVEFKDSISAKDARWQELETAVTTIEMILKDLGSFKPWVAGATPPPQSLKYKGIRRRISPRRAISFKAELSGGACTFSVEGALPAGLTLDTETGTISGKVTEAVEVTVAIIAKNDAGEVREEVSFAVGDPSPTNLSYPELEGVLTVGERNAFSPVLESGFGRSWTIEPPLPDGFAIDEASGAIHGTATAPVETREYTVTVLNAGGSTTTTFSFGAQVPPPIGLSYPALRDELAIGRSVALDPELESGFPTEFTVSPPLPDGLSFCEKTGAIRGAPAALSESVVYVVVAKNDSGEVKAELTFACVSIAPASLVYPNAVNSYTNAELVSLVPEVGGGMPDMFTVAPELPAGLIFSTVDGSIEGVPQGKCDKGSWIVTATNSAGSTTCELSFAVTRAPPSSLAYPSLKSVYAVGRAVTVSPTAMGEVDEFSVKPPLPGGLALDPKTGIITGKPSSSAPEASYQITAKNDQGSTVTMLSFCLEVLPPDNLTYPSADTMYSVGETVGPIEPNIEGGADAWTVYPALPAGIVVDASTGVISGSPEEVTETQFYTVTASNEAGKASFDLELTINPCAPRSVSYPSLGEGGLVVEEPVDAAPLVEPEGSFAWSVEPSLPPGLSLDEKTGRITGTPETETESSVYRVTAQNVAGSITCDQCLTVEPQMEEAVINVKFAEELEELGVDDMAIVLEKAPPKDQRFGDWMIWMVHRAHLNDSTLVDFNFTHCVMPLPHQEYRVAPKLMKALETNTNIERLVLCHANMQKPQGHELAEALRKNTTISHINIEGNHLDSSCMLSIAKAMGDNQGANLQEVRLSYQQGMGKSFGNAVEEAFGQMIKQNHTITSLGFSCDQPHWRDTISRALLMNNDRARRTRKKRSPSEIFASVPCEDKTLAMILLSKPPGTPASDLLADDGGGISAFKKFVADSTKLPTPTQLQSKAKNDGVSLKFAELKPTIETCRSQLLNAAKKTDVTVTDTFNAQLTGTLISWEYKNHTWNFEMLDQNGEKRYKCSSQTEPLIGVSESWSKWLKGEVEE